jgi:hypothetical protein
MNGAIHPELAVFVEQGRAILQLSFIPEMWRAFEQWDNNVGDWLAQNYPQGSYVAEWTGMIAEGLYTGPEDTEAACLNETVRRRIAWLGSLQRSSSAQQSLPDKVVTGDRSRKGYEFEREVAAIYRALGARVEREVALAGSAIDILAEETTPSGSAVRIAVECKAFTRPVGVDVVNRFVSLIGLLKQRRMVDRGALVTTSGFTAAARAAAKEASLELLQIADLEHRAEGKTEAVRRAEIEIDEAQKKVQASPNRPQRVFVVMPFASEFDDVYVLGIREVAEKLGVAAERADEIEHNENILEVVQESIRRSDAVIADISGRNPNVLYEVGYAHAVGRPTVLLCRKEEAIPFDLQSMNQIRYASIGELRDRLERRLKKMLDR